MDNWDREQEFQEREHEARIQSIRDLAKGQSLIFSGFCYYCDEEVRQPFRFCDLNCHSDYEREQKLRAIAGLK